VTVHDEAPGNLMCLWSAATRGRHRRGLRPVRRTSRRLSIRSPRPVVHYMETRAAWSAYDAAEDVVTVTFASQGVQIPHRLMCERVLDLPKDKLRLVTEDVGGGFGPKYPISPESTLIAWATRKLGRGLRWSAERAEHALSDSHSRDLVASAELALGATGQFLGVRVKAEANFGAYLSMFAPSIPTTGLAKVMSGLYRIPAMHIAFDCAFTNTVPVDAIRGAGKPEALFLLERLIDIAAQRDRPHAGRAAPPQPARAGRDALQAAARLHLRCRRLPAPVRDRAAGGRRRGLRRRARRARPAASCAASARLPSARHRRHRRRARRGQVERRPAGRARRHAEPGPGHETVFAQICRGARRADRAHRGAPGRHAHHPARRRHRRLVLDHHQRHDAEARRRRGDRARARPRRERLERAGRHRLSRRRLEVVARTARSVCSSWRRGSRSKGDATFADKIETYPTGVRVCEVEIRSDTGAVTIDRLTEVVDCGLVINPRLLAGQLHGGIVHGVGNALMEEAK
jgi:carbon-monoxide dehydrogenase large subunit